MEAELKRRVLLREASAQVNCGADSESPKLLRRNSGANLLRRSVQQSVEAKKKQNISENTTRLSRGEKRALSNTRARANTAEGQIHAVEDDDVDARDRKEKGWLGAKKKMGIDTSESRKGTSWFTSSTKLPSPTTKSQAARKASAFRRVGKEFTAEIDDGTDGLATIGAPMFEGLVKWFVKTPMFKKRVIKIFEEIDSDNRY
jgi:hypothetical protein